MANPDIGKVNPFEPVDSSRGPLDSRKLTIRVYTPVRDRIAALAQELNMKESSLCTVLLELSLEYENLVREKMGMPVTEVKQGSLSLAGRRKVANASGGGGSDGTREADLSNEAVAGQGTGTEANQAIKDNFPLSSVTQQDTAGLPGPDDTPEAREYLSSIAERQRAYAERTGAKSIPVLRSDPSDINDSFPVGSERRQRTVAKAKAKGVQGMNDFEILTRYLNDFRLDRANEFTNISPIVRQTDSQGNAIRRS